MILCILFLFICTVCTLSFFFFFFNDTATTEIYTLSLHDALPILHGCLAAGEDHGGYRTMNTFVWTIQGLLAFVDRKSTRLNSSHANISYAVFCLKKKKKNINITYY